MINYPKFKENLSVVRARVARACELSGRLESSVSLLPVTKNNPVEAIDYAVRGGLKAVGENRVQEASDKRDSCTNEIRWELIGHLQSNKAQDAVAIFDRIQSVDSLKLLRRLDRFAGEQGKKLAILLQCNTGKDPNKHGFAEEEVPSAMEVALELSNLQVDGLMTIAPLDDNPKVAGAAFKSLRELRNALSENYAVPLPELSMGMTGDLELAIAAGSTQIRVGTALSGERMY